MRTVLTLALLFLISTPALADEKPKPNTLTPKEIADGWLLLFDGETTFGWKISGDVKVKDGTLFIGGGKTPTTATVTTRFGEYDAVIDTDGSNGAGQLVFKEGDSGSSTGLLGQPHVLDIQVRIKPDGTGIGGKLVVGQDKVAREKVEVQTAGPSALVLELPAGATVAVKSAKLRPVNVKPLFNGKNLDGWKVFNDPKRMNTKFEVTKDGELSAKNGPGDLQTTGQYDNFALQLECKTNGKGLNSGVFFRCIADQYQNGYEAQIHNGYKGDDRTKPVDFGSGAIYRRVPARKVVANDNEWFTMTVVADGPHFATWVNGYQTADWTDDRKPNDNPRNGLRTAKGHLSIQGHDPTTDLLFRNIRIAELPTRR